MISAGMVARVWQETLRETPCVWQDMVPLLATRLGMPRMSYRDRLTRRRRNAAGEVIPQIVLVRANLRRLGKPRVPPRIPV